jgi:hypothetical protein
MTIAQSRTAPKPRELRALELYRTRGHEIHQTAEDLYLVPSCRGGGFYSVDYREETCDCPDHEIRQENCKHILALGIAIAKGRIVHPELAAGDPFIAADKNRPHACDDGWVTIGQIVVDPETGEEREEFALYLCSKCAERS